MKTAQHQITPTPPQVQTAPRQTRTVQKDSLAQLRALASVSASSRRIAQFQRQADAGMGVAQLQSVSEAGYTANNSNQHFGTNHIGTTENAKSKSENRDYSTKLVDTNTVLLISDSDAKALVAAADFTKDCYPDGGNWYQVRISCSHIVVTLRHSNGGAEATSVEEKDGDVYLKVNFHSGQKTFSIAGVAG